MMMRSIELRFRLIPGARAEQEWLYLINESYIGERCIVPLLRALLDAPVEGVGFRRMVARQILEEEEHVARYSELLAGQAACGSGYDRDFAEYVLDLPNTTLKLYALQALLEGISLGALRYRREAVFSAWSDDLDRRVLLDEERHVRFARPFMCALIAADGVVERQQFDVVAKQVNAIFARHFNGAHLARLMRSTFGRFVSAESIDASIGMKRFYWKSVTSVLATKAEFLGHYHAAQRAA
jgi:hypothetical protein